MLLLISVVCSCYMCVNILYIFFFTSFVFRGFTWWKPHICLWQIFLFPGNFGREKQQKVGWGFSWSLKNTSHLLLVLLQSAALQQDDARVDERVAEQWNDKSGVSGGTWFWFGRLSSTETTISSFPCFETLLSDIKVFRCKKREMLHEVRQMVVDFTVCGGEKWIMLHHVTSEYLRRRDVNFQDENQSKFISSPLRDHLQQFGVSSDALNHFSLKRKCIYHRGEFQYFSRSSVSVRNDLFYTPQNFQKRSFKLPSWLLIREGGIIFPFMLLSLHYLPAWTCKKLLL